MLASPPSSHKDNPPRATTMAPSIANSKRQVQQVLRASSVSMTAPQEKSPLPQQGQLHMHETRSKQIQDALLNGPKPAPEKEYAVYQGKLVLSELEHMGLKPQGEYQAPMHQIPQHLKGKSIFPKISSRSDIRSLHRSAAYQQNNSKLITIIMPQHIPRYAHHHNASAIAGSPDPRHPPTPSKPPASVILKKLSSHTRNYVGKHSKALQDTTPRFPSKQQHRHASVRGGSHDYTSNTPSQNVGSLSPSKTRNPSGIQQKNTPLNETSSDCKEYPVEITSYEDTDGAPTNFITRRKDSATSALTQPQVQKAFTKQKRVSFRHGPLRGIRIGDRAALPEKTDQQKFTNDQDEFSLSGEGLIPTHHLRQGYVPQTAPSNKRTLSTSLQEYRDAEDDPYTGQSPDSDHPALREIMNYGKQVESPGVWALEAAFSPPISPTTRNSLSQQQVQYLLNHHKNLIAPGQAVLAMEGGMHVPATLMEGREYFPSPPKPLGSIGKPLNPKGHLRRSYNYSSSSGSQQFGAGSYFNSYIHSPLSGREARITGAPMVSAHLGKINPEQCISMSSDQYSGSMLSTQQAAMLQSLKFSEQLHASGGSYLLEMPGPDRHLLPAPANTNSDMTLPQLDPQMLQGLKTYPDFTRLNATEEERDQEKREMAQRHKAVCPFHKKLIWLSLGQPLKHSTVSGLRKFRNKNPNCNHNNNSMLYQPLLSANKLEEILRHKEEALKSLYFSTAISKAHAARLAPFKTELDLTPQKVGGASLADSPKTERQLDSTPGDCEVLRGSTSSPDIRLTKLRKQTERKTQVPHEVQDLQKATGKHRHFLYALLRVNKIVKENFQRIIQEVKALSGYHNEGCIFCYGVLPISILFFSGFVSSHSGQPTASPGVVSLSYLIARQQNLSANGSQGLLGSPSNITNFQRNLSIVKFLGGVFVRASQQVKTPQKQAALQQGGAGQSAKKKSEGKEKAMPKKERWEGVKDKRALLKGGDKDKLLEYREYNFRDFLKKMNEGNGLAVAAPTGTFQPYKAYIGKGNNSILVRMALKQRWWWNVVYKEEWENYNFAWTQWKSARMIATLKKHHEVTGGDSPSSLVTSPSTASSAVSSSHQGSSLKLLDESSSTQNLQEASVRSVEAPRKASSVVTKKRLVSSSVTKQRGGSVEREDRRDKKKKDSKEQLTKEAPHSLHISNHIECHYHLSNKKALFLNMRLYYDALNQDMFDYMPVTFHLKEGADSKEWEKFEQCYMSVQSEIEEGQQEGKDLDKAFPEKEALMRQTRKKPRNLWIVKPGENTNRGFGIIVARDLAHIKELISHQVRLQNGHKRSYIVQKYIDRPLLFHRRKFDIRCYAMVTSVNGNVRGYFYQDGYLRTACKEFSIKNITNRFIHLTNDAIQKRHEDYGKFESGNKLSYNDFQRYMDNHHPETKLNMMKEIIPRIKRIVTDTIKATYKKIDPNRRHQSFEVGEQRHQIFGYDFMVDEEKKVLLIQVNTNPCLELSCPLLARLIPQMIENSMRLAVDPLFPPPQPWPNSKKHHIPDIQSENKFDLVFDEATDAAELNNLPFHNVPIGEIIEEEDDENESASSDSDTDL